MQHEFPGWFLTIDGQSYVLSGEHLHTLLAHGTQVDYHKNEQVAVTLLPRETPVKITHPFTLTLPLSSYLALVYSVAHSRYHMEETRYHEEITLFCFSESRPPQDPCEALYWYVNLWWQCVREEEKDQYFLPGEPLDWCTRAALGNYTEFRRLWLEHEERREGSVTV